MPRISMFYGIAIWIYYDEIHHRGRPHFHATYSGDEASIDIETLEIIAGALSPRARQLVGEWAQLHQGELPENWERSQRHERLQPIEPLR